MLIGANDPVCVLYYVYEKCWRRRSGKPYALRTVPGWAVLGPVNVANSSSSQVANVNYVKHGDELSDRQMRKFLRIDDIDMNRSSKKAMSVEDQETLKTLENSVRVVDGHHETGMLWRSVTPWMPNNKQMAKARLQSLKRKLQRDEMFRKKYREVMENLIEGGFARKSSEEVTARQSGETWYLLHHGVFHSQKDKIRTVFDAVAMQNGVLLNNRLH